MELKEHETLIAYSDSCTEHELEPTEDMERMAKSLGVKDVKDFLQWVFDNFEHLLVCCGGVKYEGHGVYGGRYLLVGINVPFWSIDWARLITDYIVEKGEIE